VIDSGVFVQARMSSKRLPGKMLAPLAGRPLIAHVLSRICEAVPRDRVILLTSVDPSDDPLATYVEAQLGCKVFRGALDNVVLRFQECLRTHPFECFARISGDSPAIDPGLLRWMLDRVSADTDLLTNVARRTFPPGQSIEIIRSSTFLAWNAAALTAEEREHVTPHFYAHRDRYSVRNVESGDAALAQRRLVVDTLEDLRAMEQMLAADPEATRGYAAHARLEAGDD
jgi:spore coat polysaccharide biosynthesis protein SpsF